MIKRNMKTLQKLSFLVFAGLLASATLPARSQFVTIARKIKSKHTQTTEVSTVTLDARPFMVYRAVMDTVASSSALKLVGRNDQKRQIDFMAGTGQVKIEVDSLGPTLSQITVSASDPVQPSAKTTETSVNAILAVCHKLGIHCTVEEP